MIARYDGKCGSGLRLVGLLAAPALGFAPAHSKTLATGSVVEVRAVKGDPSHSVTYGDLDLASDAGAAALQARIRGAVREVCETAWANSADKSQAFVDACRSESLVRASAEAGELIARARAPQWAVRD